MPADSTRRIDAIDFTKGVLVLLMVIYHVLNYLDYAALPHDYMAFLPPSFIMIAGFLVVHRQAGQRREESADDDMRLAVRALKLLLIFTCLNLAARMVWTTNHYGVELSTAEFFRRWPNVFLAGDAEGVAFDVLVPIAYTLLLSVVALRIQEARPWFLGTFALLFVILCALTNAYGRSINYLDLISAGVVGMWLGTFNLHSIDLLAMSRRVLMVTLVAYLCLATVAPDIYITQVLETGLSLFVLYSVGCLATTDQGWFRQVCLLGKYSLVSYIVQILYLQGAKGILGGWQGFPVGKVMLLSFVIGALTWVTVVCVDYARAKNQGVNRLYKVLLA